MQVQKGAVTYGSCGSRPSEETQCTMIAKRSSSSTNEKTLRLTRSQAPSVFLRHAYPEQAKKGGAPWPYRGVQELRLIQKRGVWPDGQPLGKGYPQPCLQDRYAAAIIEGRKTFEGRPGGGWLIHRGRMIRAGDYVNSNFRGVGRSLRSRRCSVPHRRPRTDRVQLEVSDAYAEEFCSGSVPGAKPKS